MISFLSGITSINITSNESGKIKTWPYFRLTRSILERFSGSRNGQKAELSVSI